MSLALSPAPAHSGRSRLEMTPTREEKTQLQLWCHAPSHHLQGWISVPIIPNPADNLPQWWERMEPGVSFLKVGELCVGPVEFYP